MGNVCSLMKSGEKLPQFHHIEPLSAGQQPKNSSQHLEIRSTDGEKQRYYVHSSKTKQVYEFSRL